MDDVEVAVSDQASESVDPTRVGRRADVEAMGGDADAFELRDQVLLPGQEVGRGELERVAVAHARVLHDEAFRTTRTETFEHPEDARALGHRVIDGSGA